jgi:cysteinyl-tRNA synthetase
MNITDVGHLTDDGDDGDDKMEKGARRDGATAWDVAEKYTKIFVDDITRLGANHFSYMPRATQYIQEQIDMVSSLEDQ